MEINDIEKRYDAAVKALKQGMIDKLNGVEISLDKEEEIETAFYSTMQEYVKHSYLKKFTGVSVSFEEILTGLSSFKPFTVESDQGFVTFIHGTPNGDVAIEGTDSKPQLVTYTSEKFADLVEVQETYIVSCYPGGKADSWETSGKRFFNIGDKLRPLGLAVENDTLYIGYVSYYHQEFIEKDYAKLCEKFAAAAE